MFDLNRVKLIAMRELMTRLKQRSFRITLILQCLVIVVVALAPVLLTKFFGDDDGLDPQSLIVLDQSDSSFADRLAPMLKGDGDTLADINVTSSTESADNVRAAVDDGDADAALIVSEGDQGLTFTYVSKDTTTTDVTQQRVYAAANSLESESRLTDLGLSSDEATNAMTPISFQVEGTDSGSTDEGPSGV